MRRWTATPSSCATRSPASRPKPSSTTCPTCPSCASPTKRPARPPTALSCTAATAAGLIKTLHHRRELRARQGRRPTGLDDRYFRQAEDQLYGELGYVLGIAREDAPAYIRERLGTRGAEE